ncbi:MAG: proliferating cell nuclear antigen (pcna) [Candidatus Nanoarchaeia archaeon]|nr:proliferating cell nuclear antigen (pcna) [Candidatus Nanoarchaeia archaeon]
MFRALLTEPKVFIQGISAASDLITEGTFRLKKEGIQLLAMDPASVAMIVLNVLSSVFAEYSLDEDKDITLNMSEFYSVLKRAKSTDKVIIELNEDENQLDITMKNGSTRKFSLPLLNNTESVDKIPELSYDGEIELDSKPIKEGIDDASLVSDNVILIADGNGINMKAAGSTSKMSLSLDKDSGAILNNNHPHAKAKYSVEYLGKIMKNAGIFEKVKIQFKDDYPIRIDYTLVDKMKLIYIVAPRVDIE